MIMAEASAQHAVSWTLSVASNFQFDIMLYRAGDWFMVGRHKAVR